MTSMKNIPVVTLRDMVVYPHGVQPLFIGTEKSIRALDHAQKNDKDKQVLLVAKRAPEDENPGPDDLYAFGTVATILAVDSSTGQDRQNFSGRESTGRNYGNQRRRKVFCWRYQLD